MNTTPARREIFSIMAFGIAIVLFSNSAVAQSNNTVDQDIQACEQAIDAGQSVTVALAGIKNPNGNDPVTAGLYQSCANDLAAASGLPPTEVIIVPNPNGLVNGLLREPNMAEADRAAVLLSTCGDYASHSSMRAEEGNGIRVLTFSNGAAALAQLLQQYGGLPGNPGIDQVTVVGADASYKNQVAGFANVPRDIPFNYFYSPTDWVLSGGEQSVTNAAVVLKESANLANFFPITSSEIQHNCDVYVRNASQKPVPPRNVGSGSSNGGGGSSQTPPPPDPTPPILLQPDPPPTGTVTTSDCFGVPDPTNGVCYSCEEWNGYCLLDVTAPGCDMAEDVCGFAPPP